VTRQIARAILLATCLTIVIAGLTAYLMVRRTVISQLDQLLVERAAAVLRDVSLGRDDQSRRFPEGDRYLIRTDAGQTIARLPSDRAPPVPPEVVSSAFADTADQGRVRTIALRSRPQPPEPAATIIYSTSARAYDAALRALAVSLSGVTAAGVLVTLLVARHVARRATRPLAETAAAIGEIDERNLGRRIDLVALPPELLPVAERLNEMLARIEAAFSRQGRFLVDAAHELRTPVAALRTTAEVALDGPRTPASLTRALERCLNSSRLLERLAMQLMEALRTTSPAASSSPAVDERAEPTNAGRLVRDCVDALEPLAAARGISIAASPPADTLVHADPNRLSSVVINLLSNSIEYTPQGGRIDVHAGVTGEGHWRLVVRDTGIGIAPEHLDRVFDPFFRADKARDRVHLGLGLYLVKSHVQAMGGEVTVNSQLGAGTTFTVILSAAAAGRDAGLVSGVEVPVAGAVKQETKELSGVGSLTPRPSRSIQDRTV
jgi:signal transduction histidine kinase